VRPYTGGEVREEHLIESQSSMSAILLQRGNSNTGRGLFQSSCCCSWPSSRTQAQRKSLLHLTHSHSSGPLHLSRRLKFYHPTIQPLQHQHRRQRQPLLLLPHLPVISGMYRQPLSSTSTSATSDNPSVIMEWSAERVRNTFIEFFQKNGHTFGLSLRFADIVAMFVLITGS